MQSGPIIGSPLLVRFVPRFTRLSHFHQTRLGAADRIHQSGEMAVQYIESWMRSDSRSEYQTYILKKILDSARNPDISIVSRLNQPTPTKWIQRETNHRNPADIDSCHLPTELDWVDARQPRRIDRSQVGRNKRQFRGGF